MKRTSNLAVAVAALAIFGLPAFLAAQSEPAQEPVAPVEEQQPEPVQEPAPLPEPVQEPEAEPEVSDGSEPVVEPEPEAEPEPSEESGPIVEPEPEPVTLNDAFGSLQGAITAEASNAVTVGAASEALDAARQALVDAEEAHADAMRGQGEHDADVRSAAQALVDYLTATYLQ